MDLLTYQLTSFHIISSCALFTTLRSPTLLRAVSLQSPCSMSVLFETVFTHCIDVCSQVRHLLTQLNWQIRITIIPSVPYLIYRINESSTNPSQVLFNMYKLTLMFTWRKKIHRCTTTTLKENSTNTSRLSAKIHQSFIFSIDGRTLRDEWQTIVSRKIITEIESLTKSQRQCRWEMLENFFSTW